MTDVFHLYLDPFGGGSDSDLPAVELVNDPVYPIVVHVRGAAARSGGYLRYRLRLTSQEALDLAAEAKRAERAASVGPGVYGKAYAKVAEAEDAALDALLADPPAPSAQERRARNRVLGAVWLHKGRSALDLRGAGVGPDDVALLQALQDDGLVEYRRGWHLTAAGDLEYARVAK